MPPRGHLTTYYGEQLSMSALRRRFGIQWDTLVRWRRHGGISERRIDRHLARRAERERVRALAAANRLKVTALRQRLYRSDDEQEVLAALKAS